jgi:hypothetical protein
MKVAEIVLDETDHILEDRHGQLSVEVGHSLRIRDNRIKQEIGLLAQTIIPLIIADVQGRNDRYSGVPRTWK